MITPTNDVTDSLETMLLLLMCSTSDGLATNFDITQRIRCDVMVPTSTFTADLTESRLLTGCPNWLLAHPAEILGDEAEAALFFENAIKWIGYRKCKAAPKRVGTLGRVAAWYECHYRLIRQDGTGTYQRRFIPIAKSGHALTAIMDGTSISDPAEATMNLCGVCSIIEDAYRSNAMLAEVSDSVEVKFPIPLDSYKEVFALRDGPMTPKDRRKAILHWVAGHIRRSARNKEFPIRKHTRGVQEFSLDGFRIRLTPNGEPDLKAHQAQMKGTA